MRKYFLGDGAGVGIWKTRKQELVRYKPRKVSKARLWRLLDVKLRWWVLPHKEAGEIDKKKPLIYKLGPENPPVICRLKAHLLFSLSLPYTPITILSRASEHFWRSPSSEILAQCMDLYNKHVSTIVLLIRYSKYPIQLCAPWEKDSKYSHLNVHYLIYHWHAESRPSKYNITRVSWNWIYSFLKSETTAFLIDIKCL